MTGKQFEKQVEELVDEYLLTNKYSKEAWTNVLIVLTNELDMNIVKTLALKPNDLEGAVFHINDFFNYSKTRCIEIYKKVLKRREEDEQKR